jgi:glycosyltransferase involved in cell wall biosynthesis
VHHEDPAETTASIVIPAHNESHSIAQLLGNLLDGAGVNEFEVVVVCNGCSDDTAEIARRFDGVTVLETEQPSKRVALDMGDAAASYFPRLYVDADVEIGCVDVRYLIHALDGVLASAPERVIPRVGTSRLVRAYYDVWERLPQVRSGLFGRGVIAMSAEGFARVSQLPPMMSDDLAVSEAFGADERRIASDARVIIRPPRTLRDLFRRRVRVHTGNAQMDQTASRSADAKTSPGDLLDIIKATPRLLPSVFVFAGVAVVAKVSARRRVRSGDFTTWLRDESSRGG